MFDGLNLLLHQPLFLIKKHEARKDIIKFFQESNILPTSMIDISEILIKTSNLDSLTIKDFACFTY
ncbi:MAG: hypothetical protein ACJ0QO_01985 [Parvicellaceae bacterium]